MQGRNLKGSLARESTSSATADQCEKRLLILTALRGALVIQIMVTDALLLRSIQQQILETPPIVSLGRHQCQPAKAIIPQIGTISQQEHPRQSLVQVHLILLEVQNVPIE